MIEITEEQREVLKLAIEIYGEENQIDKCIEEMAELTQALLKWRHSETAEDYKSGFDYLALVGEVADVRIMIEQVIMIYGEESTKEMIGRKIKRLAQRLHEEV